MGEWHIDIPLSNCLKIRHGKDQKLIENPDGKYPILGTGGIMGFTNHFLCDRPSVLIGRKGTIDVPQYMDAPFWTIDTLFYSDVDAKYDVKFLYYIFQTIRWRKYNEASGVPSLNAGTVEKIRISVPKDTKEQEEIAKILTTVDTVIEKTKALIEKYKSIKTGLMQDLLNNGIDEHGNIRSSETHEYKDSPLGIIPTEWDVLTLGELTEKIADRDHTTPVYVQHGVFIVSPKDFDEDDNIDFSHCVEITYEAHLVNRKKTDIRPGDLIFTRIGAGLGKICYVTTNMPEFSILHSAAMVRTNNKISSKLLMYNMKSFYLQKQISYGVQSIGVPDLGMEKIYSLLVKYPHNPNEQLQIQQALDSVFDKIKKEQVNLKKLLNIKQGLMQDLLTHTVPVDDLL